MSKPVPQAELPNRKKKTFAKCPRCSEPVDGFQIDVEAIDDIVVTLRPCGCGLHSSEGFYRQFIDVVRASGTLNGSGLLDSPAAPAP